MPTNYIDDDGTPTKAFMKRADDVVDGFLRMHRTANTGVVAQDMFAICVCEENGRVSYWGILDMRDLPEEDVYINAENYFYSAVRSLGEGRIVGFGICSLISVMMRKPF